MKAALFVSILFFSACQQAPAAGGHASLADSLFSISGNIKGLNIGTAVLTYIRGQQVKADSSVLVNGHFKFTGSLQEPQEVQLSFINEQYNGAISFFAGNNTINIAADTAALARPVIDGSATQLDLENLQQLLQPTLRKKEQFATAARALFQAGTPQNATADSLAAVYKTLEAEKTAVVTGFVQQHPASAVSPWAINKYLLPNIHPDTVQTLFATLTASNQSGLYSHLIKEFITAEKATAIGRKAIPFTLPDVHGKPVALNSFQGKYVLVDFWASWCGPCRKESPALVAAYKKYMLKGFTILGVSMDDDKAAWLKAIAADKLSWTQVSDLKGWNSNISNDYAIKGIPFNLLLDKDGRIIAKNLRGAALEKQLAQILP